jgi:hypothetical protein
MKNLKEIKLMMERIESPRWTDTEYQKRKKIIKESSEIEAEKAKEVVKDVVNSSEFNSEMEKVWSQMSPEEKKGLEDILEKNGIIDSLNENLGGESDFNKAVELGMELTENINEVNGDEKTLKQKIGKAIATLGKINIMTMTGPTTLLASAFVTSGFAIYPVVAAGFAVGGILWWLGDKIAGERSVI